MATAKRQPDVTETIVVRKGGITLELTDREAQILNMMLAYTSDLDTNFPEPRAIRHALADAGVEDYWDKMYITTDELTTYGPVIKLNEGKPPHH
jgi:hypothetical protein